MPLSRDFREFIECLNSNEVEYQVFGALAIPRHGFPRYSAHIDFLIRPSSLDISVSDLPVTGKVIQLRYEPNRIDLMTSVT
jgi:hypothetical protein